MWLSGKRKNRRFSRRQVLEVKLRSSHRRQARLRRGMMLALFVGSVVLGIWTVRHGGQWLAAKLVKENETFRIRQLDIQTDGILAVEQLRRWAGASLGENLFALDLERIRRDLELVPAIRSAAVERVLPSTLRIRVSERDPVMQTVFPQTEQSYLVDAEGWVMFPRDSYQLAEPMARRDESLPRLTGLPLGSMHPGRRLAAGQAHAALAFVAAYASSPMTGVAHLREVDVGQSGVLVATTDQGCEVTLGLSSFDQQLRRWHAIHEKARRMGQELAQVDLSVSNNIPARWRQEDGPRAL